MASSSARRQRWRGRPRPESNVRSLTTACPRGCARRIGLLEHDPEKWIAVFGKDHAPTISWSSFRIKWVAVLRRECDQNKTGIARPEARVALFASSLMESFEHTDGDLWVFAYGSLMWRPGFDYDGRGSAGLLGPHRALFVYSFVPP